MSMNSVKPFPIIFITVSKSTRKPSIQAIPNFKLYFNFIYIRPFYSFISIKEIPYNMLHPKFVISININPYMISRDQYEISKSEICKRGRSREAVDTPLGSCADFNSSVYIISFN